MPVLNHVCFRETARLVVLPQPGCQVANHIHHPQHQAPALSPWGGGAVSGYLYRGGSLRTQRKRRLSSRSGSSKPDV